MIMDRFYEDIPLPLRGFSFPGPRPLMSAVIPKPSPHHENFNRMPVVGGNNHFHFSKSNSGNFGKNKNNGNKFLMQPPPRNNQRLHYNRFNLDGRYSRTNVQPGVVQYDTGLEVANSINSVHNIFHPDLMHYKAYHNSHDTLCSKKTKSPEQDKQSDAEAIKKANLAAKLKKSLEAFKKNPSYKKKNLSIINKSDGNGGAGSSKYTSEIQPCFRWDLPLTVDDLKTIRRCPSGSESDDQPNPQGDVSLIERREYSYDTEPRTASSPDIIYVKRCRKRKSSESGGCGVSKRRLIKQRRRHRSASPKLCLENNTKTVGKECESPPGPHAVRETINYGSLAIRDYGCSPTKEKTSQSSNVMKLLGVKRREFDELVNQPRSPRVQFMLGLLMKRHKELLLQRAMRSRISSVPNEEGPTNQTEELDLSPIIDSPSEINKPIKLEGKGASDTIDQLSNILLESSLTVDISSLPQELIDQLGTFLEMGADIGTHSGNVEESSDGEPNAFIESSDDLGVSEESRNLKSGVYDTMEETSHDASKCDNEITTTSRGIGLRRNVISRIDESQTGRVSTCDEQWYHVSEQTCDEEIEKNNGSSLTFTQGSQNVVVVKKETLCREEISNPKHIQRRHGLTGASNLSPCAGRPPKPPPNIPEDENASTNEEHPQQNCVQYDQYSHSNSLSHDTADHSERVVEYEGSIIAKLWSIDAKILELMEEKKKLYQKLWRNKAVFHNILDINSPLATSSQSNNVPRVPSCEKISCLSSQSSVHTHENVVSPVFNVLKSPDPIISERESEDEICHTLRGSASSKSSEDFSQDTSAVMSEKIQQPISSNSPKAASLQRHENRRKSEKLSVSSSPASDHCHNLLSNNENISLDSNLMEVSSQNSNTKSAVADLVPHCKPTSVDLDADIVEIIDEPLEIIYDSNLPEKSRKEGEFIGHKNAVLALKAAGKYLFACCSDLCVHCYDIKSCNLLRTYKGHTEKVTCLHVELSGKNNYLYSGSHDQQLLRFDIKDGTLKRTKKLTEPIQCMVEGWGFIFLGTKRGKIERYNIKNASFVWGLSGLNNEIMEIQTSKEGPRQVLIVATRNMPLIVRDAMTGLLLRTINEDMLKHITYSIYEYQGLIFAGTSNYGVVAYDFTNGKVIQTYTGCGCVVSVKVENDKVYAASYNGKIYIYDIKGSSPTNENNPKQVIDASTRMLLCMDQQDDMIFAGSINGQLKFWKTP